MIHSTGNQLVRPQWRGGPLADWLDAFADWTAARGYAPSTSHRMILLASCFSQWLKQEAIAIADINPDHATRYLRHRAQRLRPRQHDRTSLRHFLDLLQREGVLSFEDAPTDPLTDAERCVQAYERYLQQTRGLAPTTRATYVPFVRSFLHHRFDSGPVTLSSVDADDVVRFVRHMAPGLRPKRAKLLATALRSFLRYACHLGEVGPELAAAVPVVANWSMTRIPRGISSDQVAKLLAGTNRGSATGRRDHAILTLLARLGLRASEIQLLELDDIDWVNGTLRLRTKGGRCNMFPLFEEVGEAIVDYLRHGRPTCPDRRVFLRARAPIEGFRRSSSISCIVRHAIKRAGVDAPTGGAHQFRHGLATEMLKGGASLGEIGDVLGHAHPDTTRIYAKVDLEALRPLALAGRCPMNTLREAVHDYIDMRRNLGFKLTGTRRGLLAFATFMEQRQAPFITVELALEWAQQPVHAQPSHRARRLSYVRIFARHRKAADPRTEIPPPALLPFQPKRARPYIYSDEEIRKLLQAALDMPYARERCALQPWLYHCLFGLLAVSGIRVGEARGLELRDVDLDAAVLTVRGAKFGRDRLVPLHVTTCEILTDYIARRERHWRDRQVSNFLFVSGRGNRLDHADITRTFQKLSRRIGLRGETDSHGPRLHDMRHRFATTALVNCYRRDQDPDRLLPILSTWLGHVKVQDTQYYLEASPELMREAVRRLESRWEDRP